MPHFARLGLLLCLALGAPGALAAGPDTTMSGAWMMPGATPTGRWVTPSHNAVIEIQQCGQDLCGKIVGIALDPGDPIPKDWQGDTQCGLTIIKTAPDDPSGKTWTGTILDPRNGNVYHARITLDASHHLLLRGYIGLPIFGQTQTWAQYAGPPAQNCRLATSSTPGGNG